MDSRGRQANRKTINFKRLNAKVPKGHKNMDDIIPQALESLTPRPPGPFFPFKKAKKLLDLSDFRIYLIRNFGVHDRLTSQQGVMPAHETENT